jgi:excisionase family DNA binding protein
LGESVSDPLSAAVEAAVIRAIEAQFPKIIKALAAAASAPTLPPSGEDRFLKTGEAARLLGIHRSTIARLEKSGKLPPRRRVGASVGYLESDLSAITGKPAFPRHTIPRQK